MKLRGINYLNFLFINIKAHEVDTLEEFYTGVGAVIDHDVNSTSDNLILSLVVFQVNFME